jgi:type IV pilus assembly protein PilX
MKIQNRWDRRTQQGAALIVALVLLLVLTVLGTAGLQDTTMEERMAGNFLDYSTAFDAAETALRTGEVAVSVTSVFNAMAFDGTDGTFEVTSVSVDPETAASWREVAEELVKYEGEWLVSENAEPEYYIEQLPEIALPASDLTVGFQDQAPRVRYYRVTAKGTGKSPNAEVILQSTYFR